VPRERFGMNLEERLERHLGCVPELAEAAFVAVNATICGDVRLGRDASVFYGAVLRGDIQSIVIGTGSNVQDNAIVHLSDDHGTVVGDWVTVGHGATLHGCTVEDGCLIGMGAIVLDGARIGADSIVGAGSLVTMGFSCPPGSMVMGRPAKVTRPLRPDEVGAGRRLAEKYVVVARAHAARAAAAGAAQNAGG
jgi:carbonic anhydrase/acetyltransferase-like protein (isoleucine patch superfamily)